MNTATLKQLALLLGLALYTIVLTLVIWSNYHAPRLKAQFEWQDKTWVATKDIGPLQEGDQLKTLNGERGTRHAPHSPSRQRFSCWPRRIFPMA